MVIGEGSSCIRREEMASEKAGGFVPQTTNRKKSNGKNSVSSEGNRRLSTQS